MTDEDVFEEKKVNASDSDVTIESADGVLFCLHTQNLKITTGAFPGSEFSTKGEPTKLTENSDVLEIVFAYTYPQRHPELENMEFDLLAKIAETVEKYEVFPAMYLCTTRMREFLPEHADEILLYGIKHDYPKIVDEAALALSRSPLSSKFIFKFSSPVVLAWTRYSESWDIIFETPIEDLLPAPAAKTPQCSIHSDGRRFVTDKCHLTLSKWVKRLEKIPSAADLKAALSPLGRLGVSEPSYCNDQEWGLRRTSGCLHKPWAAETIQDSISKIPPFGQYLDEAKNYLEKSFVV